MNPDASVRDELLVAVTASLIELRGRRRQEGGELSREDEETAVAMEARRYFDDLATRTMLGGGTVLDSDAESDLVKQVMDSVLGFGPIQRLLDDPEITDIHVRGTAPVWVRLRDGSRRECDPVVSSDDELIRLVRNVASRSRNGERRFDAATAECNLCLDDGSRMFAVMDVSRHPSLVIRKHQFKLSSLVELERSGMFSPEIRRFLRAAVLARRNVVIAGGTGSGKTTLLRGLMNEIPHYERIVTIEDAFELGIDRFASLHPDHDALQSRSANSEGRGEISLADLTRMALRMDPDRVVVGEVRGAEAFPMLMAMSQGNNGSMCTLHADSTRSVFSKLVAYVSMAGTGLPVEVVNLLVANSVHLVVHIENVAGARRVTSIREVVDSEGSRISSNELFAMNQSGDAVPAFPMTTDLRNLLAEHGYESMSSLVSTVGVGL